MNDYKSNILKYLCYTDLVFDRIRKKLNLHELSNERIELFVLSAINNTTESKFVKSGKNIYVSNNKMRLRLTINSNNYRIITVDKLKL